MNKTKDQTALITGAGSGLGRAIAITLSKMGYTVVLTGRTEEKLRKVERGIENGHVIVIAADVTNEQSIQELRSKMLAQTGGRLDVLVNNVGGVSAMGSIEDITLDEWNLILDTNLTSQFLVTKAFLPDLRKNGGGKIISITSMMSQYFMKGYGPYSASKAGVEALMKTVIEEEKEHGIEVHLFDPGSVISESSPEGGQDPMEVMDKFTRLLA